MPYAFGAKVEHEFDTDHLNIWLTFRHPMDQDLKPPLALWLLEVEAVPVNITASAWQDQFTLLLTSDTVAVYPIRVTVEYNGPNSNLQTTWGKDWEPWGPILSTDIGRIPSFVDRGDPAAYDYDKDDLTKDGAWHDMDLSSIIPVGAKAVFIIGHLQGAGVDWHIKFRKKGNVNEIAHGGMETLRAGVERHRSSVIALDADRVIQYNVDNQAWTTLDLAVKGWWF